MAYRTNRSPYDSVRRKVRTLFTRIAGNRAQRLDEYPHQILALLTSAMRSQAKKKAWDIAFHLTDWNYDAAFLVAFHLFPEKFTPAEIRAGVNMLLVHIPKHVIAAARLNGDSTEDVFAEDEVSPK